MALKIIDARRSGFPHDGQFGRVHLVFDRDIDANPLRLSILKLLGREYLGRSFPPKANWTPARSHFFEAPLVSRGDGKTVFSLGPEVTTFIPDESTLEIASEDNAVKEVAVWSGVSVDFTWPGPPPQPEKPATPVTQAIPVLAPEMAPLVPLNPPQSPLPEPVRPMPEPAMPTPAAPIQPPPPPAPRSRMWMLIPVAVALLAGAGYWASQNRDLLCDRFGLFCDAELVTYREAQSCAAPKSCGASECIARYRDLYPNGRFKEQIDEVAVRKGRACVEPPREPSREPPRDDPEKRAYERVTACATPRTCGASVCVTDYRQMFPNGAHKADVDQIVALKGADCVDAAEKEAYDRAVGCAAPRTCGALECVADYRRRYANGPHRSDIDQIVALKGADCVDAAEKEAYDRAVGCAAPRTCGALECVADYRRRFSNGPHRAEIERIAQTKGVACEDPVEKDVYQRAEACAATKPANCGAAECVTEYRSRFPLGPHKADIDRIAQTRGATCPDLEKEAYDRAASCAGPLRCGADHCLTEYRRDYPNGRYRSLIEQIATLKGANCPLPAATPTPVATPTEPQLPPFVPLPPGAETGIRNCNARNLEPIAQMICRDADMARANSELQKAFDAKVTSMNDASDLRKEERAWIERRDRDCSVPPSGNWEINDLRKLKNCVIDHTRARINELR